MKKRSKAEKELEDLWKKNTDIPLESEYGFHLTRKWRFDFAIPDIKLAIEVDGFGRHTSMKGFCADLVKMNNAVKLGWSILRYPASLVKEAPQYVVDDILEFAETLWENRDA